MSRLRPAEYTAGRAFVRTRKLASGWVQWNLVTKLGEEIKGYGGRERTKVALRDVSGVARDEYNEALKASISIRHPATPADLKPHATRGPNSDSSFFRA